ncbi:MAG: TM2 domain-containing protein [Alloprevotella sp.]|nr:TM2 domain-containing protein [Alloprevotella sp.]MBR1651939.1 TM2 domain-containing protein [Alloprevotella sp.]
MIQYRCPKCGQDVFVTEPVSTAHCNACGTDFAVAAPSQPAQQPYGQQNAFGYQQYPYGGQQQYAYGSPLNGQGQPVECGLFDSGPSGKTRGICGLFAILLGSFGVHYFYLGKVGGGIVCILLCFISCGIWHILNLIQGIMMLTMSQAEFERKYVYTNSFMPLF